MLTPLQRHLPRQEMVAAGWIDESGVPTPDLFKSTAQGAATQVWAATALEIADAGGGYCTDCALDPRPIDDAEAARLWSLSSRLTGLDLTTDPT